jgi:hypothetical protein
VPFQVIEDGRTVVNHFTLKLTHQGEQRFQVNFELSDVSLKNKIKIVTPIHPTKIDTPERKIVLFFKFSPDVLVNGSKKVLVKVFDELTQKIVATKEVVLVGPSYEFN